MFFQGKSKDDGEPVVPTKGIKRTPSKGKHPEPEPEPESEAPKKPKKAKKPIPKPPPFPEKYRVVNIIDDQALDEVAKERKNGYQECDKAELHTRVVKRDGLIDLILNKTLFLVHN